MGQALPPELTCSQCGQPDACVIGGEILCPACCHERGSCGATREEEDTREQPPAAVRSRPQD